MNLFEQITSANILDKKVTLISYGEFGFLEQTQTIIQTINKKEHYQNAPEDKMGVELIHKPKGKRKMWSRGIDYCNRVLVYDGWVDIDLDKVVYEEMDNGMRKSRYTCFDKQYLVDVKEVLKAEKLIMEYNN